MANSLLFLYDELLDTSVRDKLRLPLTFVSFAKAEGKLFRSFRNNGHFMVPLGYTPTYGNTSVYGALFDLRDSAFHFAQLDAYYGCSLSRLHRNHNLDAMHRVELGITPIQFDSLHSLGRLMYHELAPVGAHVYLGNTDQPLISKRVRRSSASYRNIDGIVKSAFKQLYEEVSHE